MKAEKNLVVAWNVLCRSGILEDGENGGTDDEGSGWLKNTISLGESILGIPSGIFRSID